jgi:glycosyltransferase involved in cell wall biosynthesis
MPKKIAIVATASASGEKGGAERFYEGLQSALCAEGVDAEIVSAIPDESSFEAILGSYLRFYDLDLAGFDGIISTKAPGYLARHPNHVCYLLHTMRRFYDMFDMEFPSADEIIREQRRRIQEIDTAAFLSPNIRRIFVIGEEVRDRLERFNGVHSEVLYPATTLTGFRQDGNFDYLFLPGRLHRWKRVHLVIEAMKYVKAPIRLMISGTGEDAAELRALAGRDARIQFLGRISDDDMIRYYADALAVPFVPCREDFGYVAVEAFHSGKPVITCRDSGEPARLTSRFNAGLICDPTPQAVATAIDALYQAPETARMLGGNGRIQAATVNWKNTARSLVAALGLDPIEARQGHG